MKTVPVVNPNTSALPLIIKPWHKATVRWSVAEKLYICTFEGPGYKKLLFKSNTKHISSKLKDLGFTQYDVKDVHSKNFSHVRISDSDNIICWRLKYVEKIKHKIWHPEALALLIRAGHQLNGAIVCEQGSTS